MDIYGDTEIIESLHYGYMGINSESIYVFFRLESVTQKEVQKLTPIYGKDDDWSGISVAISRDTDITGTRCDYERGVYSGYVDVYTKIGRK